MLTIRDQRIGFLEVVAYLAAIMAVVGTVAWGWNLNLIVALIMLAVAYAVLRDLRALWLLRRENDQSPPSGATIPILKSLPHSQSSRPLFTTNRPRNGANRVDRPVKNHPGSRTERNTA